MNRHAIFAICSLLFVGCSANPSTAPNPITPATPEQKTALLGRVQTLAGTWEMADEKGEFHTTSVFSVTSAGSAVREVMFPGGPQEMTNMYHMDGPSIVVVHYCAMGNQPHMRAVAAGPDRIDFKFDGVTNLAAADQPYMGEMTIVFKDADNIREEWRSFKNGKLDEHAVTFELKRKKS